MTRGHLHERFVFGDAGSHGAIPLDPPPTAIVKASIRIKPLILVVTHRLARQETSDNHTVAFWVHFPVKFKEFDQNTQE